MPVPETAVASGPPRAGTEARTSAAPSAWSAQPSSGARTEAVVTGGLAVGQGPFPGAPAAGDRGDLHGRRSPSQRPERGLKPERAGFGPVPCGQPSWRADGGYGDDLDVDAI
ncbi:MULTISPECIES: hypothetical protein [unclassified Haematobacter]|uniref:hypothetical protein n=1 Tax=unclassified Haematobacter TaxID=2640585 RepID=UPI0025BECF5A|nr:MULTISPECIES: hypothetical protein [unclassified Haematobacter]